MIRLLLLTLTSSVFACGSDQTLHETEQVDTGEPWGWHLCECGPYTMHACMEDLDGLVHGGRNLAEEIADTWAGDYQCECLPIAPTCPDNVPF